MTHEQGILIARILNALCQEEQMIEPYFGMFNIPLGRCRACGMIGEVEYTHVVMRHDPQCPVTLNEQLQASMKQEMHKHE